MRISIAVAVICSACGGGSGSGGDVTPDELPAELAGVTCAQLTACCTTEEFMNEALGADSEQECRALFTGFAGLLADVLNDSIAAGRVVYHGDRMADCIDAISTLSCTEFQQANGGPFPNGACQDPFEGQVAIGGECANDFDCTSEYCSGDMLDFDGNITFGACADAPLAGDPCDNNDCAEGAFCDFTAGMPTCEALLADGSGCTSDNQCASDSCNGADGGSPGTCGAPTTCDGQ